MSKETEILGRLYLWQVALFRINELLELRRRVDRFCDTGKPQNITELYDTERERLRTCRLEGEALDCFEDKHGSLFPDIHDIQLIDQLIAEEVIIKLCTIVNYGHGKEGVIAINKKRLWTPILNEIISEAFSDDVKEKFNTFITDATTYRNKHGAHFDQESFSVEHSNKRPNEDGPGHSVGWNNALNVFDWDFVDETIPMFYASLNGYIRKLQEAGICNLEGCSNT